MKSVFVAFLFLFTFTARAEECTAVSIVDPDTQELEACRITVEWASLREPLYRLKHSDEITDAQCRTYCQDFTLLPLHMNGETVMGEVSKRLVDLYLEAHAGEFTELTKEPFLTWQISELVERHSGSDENLDRVIVRSLQSAVRERNPNIILTDAYYKRVTQEDLRDGENDSEEVKKSKSDLREATCTICQESIAQQVADGNEVVRVNCGSSNGGDVFCKPCIEGAFQYHQKCPNCRGLIEPLP